MIPLIIESNQPDLIESYLADKYYLGNLVSEVVPENDSIGLPAIKFLIDRAKFTPPQKSQAVFLIRSGHLITPAGQNALLKTLEESKPEEQFIITTHNHHLLLPTICSRCQLIRLAGKSQLETNQAFLKQMIVALGSSPAAIIGLSDQLLNDQPQEKLDQIIVSLREAYRHLPTQKRIKITNLALIARNDLVRNINPKLTLDHFLLTAAKIIR
ncbi:MAG: hypothetical protein WAV56_01790 [Microgenomates group bacterium]